MIISPGLAQVLSELRSLVYTYIKTNYQEVDVPDPGEVYGGHVEPFLHFDLLARSFSLSKFEKKLLLLCLGAELDKVLPQFYYKLLGSYYPTFTFAAEIFPGDAHLLPPASPVRFWQLIAFKDPGAVIHSCLTLPERVLHFLSGAEAMEEELMPFVKPVKIGKPSGTAGAGEILPESFSRNWLPLSGDENPVPFQLQHWDLEECRQAVISLAAHLGMEMFEVRLETLPGSRAGEIFRLLGRELLLTKKLLFIDCSILGRETPCAPGYDKLLDFLNNMIRYFPKQIICAANVPLTRLGCRIRLIVLPARSANEQAVMWKQELRRPEGISDAELGRLSMQFRLSISQMKTIAEQWNGLANDNLREGFSTLWDLCRQSMKSQVPVQLNILEAKAHLDDLVLTSRSEYLFRQFLAQARHHHLVYEEWGFAEKSNRGLGLVALFSGHPGTGKTTAAEVLANELNLDLVQVNLSRTVSKYIGETEKNLEEAFNFSQRNGAVLLFDEADSIFSKRSNVNSSNDHHANQKVSYLLQKIESYRGVTILTTNFQNAIDDAFLRRIRFVITFQLPEREERCRIWKRVFPDRLPCGELDFRELARYKLSGGEIRNAAINAAFFAAQKGTALDMPALEEAIREEFEKNKKPVLKE